LRDRKAALLAMVGSLESIASTVSDFHAYYGALVGLCFETADVSGRGVLVEDLYARPHSLNSMNASGYRMNALVGVSIVVQPPGYRYEPKSPNPFGDDVSLAIVRKAGHTRMRLEATLTQHLNAGSV